jgi:hypothetical protein
MVRINRGTLTAGAIVALALASQPVAARQEAVATPPASQAGAPTTRPRDIQLVFEREVFHYASASRRDPFRSLASEGMGPLFDDLTLRMIIYSSRPGQSVALLVDGSKKIYRLRKGEVVGNATVLDITESRVTFSVEDYGNRRQEVLDLKNQKEGA